MAFQSLENRFNEKVKNLYNGATLKFEDGKPSTNRNADPLIVNSVGKGYWSFAEGRATPIASAARDVRRLTLFTLSKRGILFLAKQQLLQTGNTFEHTRIINPAFVIGNAVPFLHIKRNLRPLALGGAVKSFLGKLGIGNNQSMYGDVASKTMKNLRKIGQLQQETFNKKSETISKSNFIKKIPFIGQTISAFTAKRSMGEVGDGWTESRPELKSYPSWIYENWDGPSSENREYGYSGRRLNYRTYLDFSDGKTKSTYEKSNSRIPSIDPAPNLLRVSEYSTPKNIIDRYKNDKSVYGTSTIEKAIDDEINKNIAAVDATITELGKNLTNPARGQAFLKYFDSEGGYYSAINGSTSLNTNAQEMANSYRKVNKKIRYITDPLNTLNGTATKNLQTAYNKLPTTNTVRPNQPNDAKNGKDDIITVSFAMGNDDHVQFRAFLKELTQESTPEYQKHQYIGRIEKFITYTSIQRNVSFKLSVIAFSEEELPVVWQRINYLTGMVYPYGVNKGIFNPNIMRFTIGNVYANQPAYITSMNTNFEDVTTTWEISKGKQVPISATITMTLALIEKNSKVSSSPFYNITENLKDETGTTVFNKTVAEQISFPRNTQTEAIKVSEQVRSFKPTVGVLGSRGSNLGRSLFG